MSKLFCSDPSMATNYLVSCLETDIEESTIMIKSIGDFVNDTSNLKGTGFEAVKGYMENYITLLSDKISIAKTLIEYINSSNEVLNNYISENIYGDPIDDSLVPQLEVTAKGIKTTIYYLEKFRYSTVSVYDEETGTTTYETVENKAISDRIDALGIELDEIEKKIEYLKRLSDADSQASSKLSGGSTLVGNIASSLN